MSDFINSVGEYLGNIKDFMSFILSLPKIMVDWFNSFPPMITTGLITISIIITTIIVIYLIILIKDVIL